MSQVHPSLQTLLDLMALQVSLTDVELEACAQAFQPRAVGKGYTLSEAGSVPEYLYFIVSGYVRLFHLNDEGEEVIVNA